MQLKFLITGCHGDLAFSIAKILKKNFRGCKVIGTDIVKKGIGNAIFDKIFLVPKSSAANYKQFILKISKRINLIIPSTEQEIFFFSKNINLFNNKVLINHNNIIKIFSNKIRTQNFLKKNFKDFSLKFCLTLEDYLKKKKKFPMPLFLKKKTGSGNQGYLVIKNKKDISKLKYYNKKNWIIEKMLDQDKIEYTCIIVRLNKIKKIIIFNRKLHRFGHTMYASTYNNQKIEKNLMNLANKINLNGSINIQFKIIKNKIKIFDINPRLSSTVRIRDMLGFQDCVWWINEKLKIKNLKKIKIKKNATVVKYFDEMILK